MAASTPNGANPGFADDDQGVDLSAVDDSRRWQWGNCLWTLVALVLLSLGVLATAGRTIKQYQTPGPFDPSRQGMCDFHNGIYFPTRAILRGVSPYGQEYAATYPVARQIPFFSPSILMLHAPLAMLPLRVSEILYFVFSVAMLVGIGVLIAAVLGRPIRIDVAIAIAAGLVFTRGGHITLFDGYFTLELILATMLAVHWGDRRPWLAALALVIVSSKPTYILPLGFLMLARGNIKAIMIGAVFSIIAAAGPMLWLAWNQGDGDIGLGLTMLQEQIVVSQEIHRAQEDESPVHSWTRVDLLAIVSKWLRYDPKEALHLIVMAVMLTPAAWVLRQRKQRQLDDGLVGITGALMLTTTLVSLYHQSYDVMLLMAPLAGILWKTPRIWREKPLVTRIGLATLIAVPLYNYASTRMVLRMIDPDPVLERVFTSINGVCLAVLLAVLLKMAWPPRTEARSVPSMTSKTVSSA